MVFGNPRIRKLLCILSLESEKSAARFEHVFDEKLSDSELCLLPLWLLIGIFMPSLLAWTVESRDLGFPPNTLLLSRSSPKFQNFGLPPPPSKLERENICIAGCLCSKSCSHSHSQFVRGSGRLHSG